MTTHKQIRQAILPLLETENNLALIGNRLFLAPIHHVSKCITFERSRRSETFRLIWHVNHLYGALHMQSLNWGRYLMSSKSGFSWYWNAPFIADELCDAIKKIALPALMSINSINDYIITVNMLDEDQWEPWDKIEKQPSPEKVAAWQDHGYPRRFVLSHILTEIALGRMETAKEFCAELSTWIGKQLIPDPTNDIAYVFTKLKPLLDNEDRKSLAELLHCYERTKIIYHKLEKIWQPTPFPLEEMV